MENAIWLDVSRLAGRAGRGVLTGVDRVEFAWLRHVLALADADTRYLLRTTRGYLLLDHRGAARLVDILSGHGLPDRGDALSRMLGKGSDPRHRVEFALRSIAVDRAVPWAVPQMIARAPAPFTYLNTGHSNLSDRTQASFAAAPNATVAVLIHDLIPITHPDLVRQDMPMRFAALIDRVRRHADLVICNSDATKADLDAHWRGLGRRPRDVVAPLGVDRPQTIPKTLRAPRSFVMLGTIEPRKNHALILDVWDRLAIDLPGDLMPDLHIIGPSGWRVDALMARIAAHPLLGRSIHLHGVLSDVAVQTHLARATALLFPSLAEGYGFPPLEAALMGALPICSDLPVFRNTLGNSAVYLDAADPYLWTETIKKHVLGIDALPVLPPPVCPGWHEHFERVGQALAKS